MDFFSPKFGGGRDDGGLASNTGDLGLESGVLRGASGDTLPGFFRRGVGGTSFKHSDSFIMTGSRAVSCSPGPHHC